MSRARILNSLAVLVVALAGAGPGVHAQTADLVERLSKDFQIENWREETEAPARIGTNKSMAIVLADIIDLGAQDFSRSGQRAPIHVFLLADTVRITKPVRFDLTPSPSERLIDGGMLVVLARRLEFAAGGSLTFISRGGSAKTETGAPVSGSGGSLILAAERLDIAGSPQTNPATWAIVLVDGKHVVTDHAKGPGGAGGLDGKAEIFAASNRKLYGRGEWFPLWVLWRLELLHTKVLEAVRGGDEGSRREIVQQFWLLRQMPQYTLDGKEGDTYRKALAALLELRRTAVPALWFDRISIQQEGSVTRELLVFTDGQSLEPQLSPTGLLLRTNSIAGKATLGITTYDPQEVQRVTLHVDAEMSLDPWLASLGTRELVRRQALPVGSDIPSPFGAWRLTPAPRQDRGVEKLEVTAFGSTLHIALTLRPGEAGLALQQLASRNGLPLKFDWESLRDPTITGSNLTLSLSLARLLAPEIAVKDGLVNNRGRWPVTLEYYRADGGYRPFKRGPQSIEPGKSETLDVAMGDVPSRATVPAQAVYNNLDWSTALAEFTGSPTEVIERVIVTNELPAFDAQRGGRLERVRVSVAYTRGTERQLAGPYDLSSAGSYAASVEVPFVRRGPGNRSIVLEGVAYYENGQQRLVAMPTERLGVSISEDNLPPVSP